MAAQRPSNSADIAFNAPKKGELNEIKQSLLSSKEDKKKEGIKDLLEVMANGVDVAALFECVVRCAASGQLETRKLCYLYFAQMIAHEDPGMVRKALPRMQADCNDGNPLIRAMAIKTMSLVSSPELVDTIVETLKNLLNDSDAYVLKTAILCVAKLHATNPKAIEKWGLVEVVRGFLSTSGVPLVLSNAVVALHDMSRRQAESYFRIDAQNVTKLLTGLDEFSEWGMVYVMDGFSRYAPRDTEETQKIIEGVSPRLQSSNSAVVLAAVKVLIKYLKYVTEPDTTSIIQKLGPPLVSLLSKEPEIQYVALRNINLLLQKHPNLLGSDMNVFFSNYNDPLYVKMEKLEIMLLLANDNNIDIILTEFKECVMKLEVDFVRKAVRAIGRSAIKLTNAADKCVHVLMDLMKSTKLDYVIQEAVVVIKDIFRRYPNQYEGVIQNLTCHLDLMDESEAKASMIWILGEYADRIEDVEKSLGLFASTFKEEDSTVQLALLTAIVKLYLLKPSVPNTQQLVYAILQTATKEIDDPDIRDRGYLYWRLLSERPAAARQIILSPKPLIQDDIDSLDPQLLDMLVDNLATLSSVYYLPALQFTNKGLGFSSALPVTVTVPVLDDSEGSLPPVFASSPPVPPRTPMSNPPPVPIQRTNSNLQSPPPPAPRPRRVYEPPISPLPVLLSSDTKEAAGLEVKGAFQLKSENGASTLSLDLEFTNFNSEALGPFMIKFNKNTFQVSPVGVVPVQSIGPGESVSFTLPCSVSAPAEIQQTDLVQIALRTNVSVAFFTVSLPLYILFVPEGRMEKESYYSVWRSINDEHCAELVLQKTTDIDILTSKLEHYNVFFVASHTVSDEEFLYVAAKTLDGALFLMELGFQNNLCKMCIKTEQVELVPLMAQSIQIILDL